MIVNVEDGDTASGPPGLFRRDRCVVEIAIAAAVVATGMMAGRPAKGKTAACFPVEDCGQRRQRGLRAPVARFPGAFGDRRRSIIAVTAEPGVNPVQLQPPSPNDRPGVADRITAPAGRPPVRVGAAQEFNIVAIMGLKQRLQPIIADWPQVGKAGGNLFGARSLLGIGRPSAVMQFLKRRMCQLAPVEIGSDRIHRCYRPWGLVPCCPS